jgi:uncharacterized protein (DUF433 family)
MPASRRNSGINSRNSRGSHNLGYTSGRMARVKVRRTTEDIRDLPSYSITEAALYLGIPPSTLKSWVRGYRGRTGRRYPPLIRPADPRRLLLSFYNLAEAHILDVARRRRVQRERMRLAVKWATATLPGRHPLLSEHLATAGGRMFVRKLQGTTIDASAGGQVVELRLAPDLRKHLKSIIRDPIDRSPVEIHPIRPVPPKKKPSRVYVSESPLAINATICSGRPIVKGTDVPASMLHHRAHAGEPLSDLARDYGLDIREVEKVIKYIDKSA